MWSSLTFPTAFLLRPYYVSYVNDRFTFLPRQRYVHTTLYKTSLRLFHVGHVLNTSVVLLYQVLTASMAHPAIKYIYKYFTDHVLNTSVVRLYQVLTASMACPAIKYIYKYFTEFPSFSLEFQLLS